MMDELSQILLIISGCNLHFTQPGLTFLTIEKDEHIVP